MKALKIFVLITSTLLSACAYRSYDSSWDWGTTSKQVGTIEKK